MLKHSRLQIIKEIAIFVLFGLMGMGHSWPQHTLTFEYYSIALFFVVLGISAIQSGAFPNVSRGGLILIATASLFSISFWALSAPAPRINGASTVMPFQWWKEIDIAIILASVVGIIISTRKEAVVAIVGFCLTISVFESYCVLYTIIWKVQEQGLVWNPFAGYCYASSGICNLIVFFPVFIASYIFFRDRSKKIKIWHYITLILAYLLISFEAIILKERAVFAILYVVITGLIIFNCWRVKKIIMKNAIGIFVGIALLFFIVISSMHRPVSMLNDARFTLYKSFINQFIKSPFTHAQVDFDSQKTMGVWWFHNFFADVDRSSGFIPYALSIILVGYIGIRIIYAYKIKTSHSYILPIFICMFLIINTSVVPEGEFQPLTLIVILGSINEALLGTVKQKTSLN